MKELSTKQISALRGKAQRLEATVKIGKDGLSDGLIQTVRDALDRQELVKIRFDSLKEQKKDLAPKLAVQCDSTLVTRIGNVVVLFRQNSDPSKRKIALD